MNLKKDLSLGLEILEGAMRFLIDLDSGVFERISMACYEVFKLKHHMLSEEAIHIYFEIDSLFDKSMINDNGDFCNPNLLEMSDEKRQEIAELILRLYFVACTTKS